MSQALFEMVVQVWLSFFFTSLSLIRLHVIELSIQALLIVWKFYSFKLVWSIIKLDNIILFVHFESTLFIYYVYKSFIDERGSQILFVNIIHEQIIITIHEH